VFDDAKHANCGSFVAEKLQKTISKNNMQLDNIRMHMRVELRIYFTLKAFNYQQQVVLLVLRW
jgi:hypothetical protein